MPSHEVKTILYIHGMGGGGDSRIPSILRDNINNYLPAGTDVLLKVVVRTYDFDPETAFGHISSWVEELHPDIIVGESLGSVHAIRLKGMPHVLVSPSLNAPLFLGNLAFLSLVPGVGRLLERIYMPEDGDRQKPRFRFRILRKYLPHRRLALMNSPASGSDDLFFAFFGTRDHYRKSGIVSIRSYRRYFGDAYCMYDGTHFMEEEYIHSLLIPKILDVLFKR